MYKAGAVSCLVFGIYSMVTGNAIGLFLMVLLALYWMLWDVSDKLDDVVRALKRKE